MSEEFGFQPLTSPADSGVSFGSAVRAAASGEFESPFSVLDLASRGPRALAQSTAAREARQKLRESKALRQINLHNADLAARRNRINFDREQALRSQFDDFLARNQGKTTGQMAGDVTGEEAANPQIVSFIREKGALDALGRSSSRLDEVDRIEQTPEFEEARRQSIRNELLLKNRRAEAALFELERADPSNPYNIVQALAQGGMTGSPEMDEVAKGVVTQLRGEKGQQARMALGALANSQKSWNEATALSGVMPPDNFDEVRARAMAEIGVNGEISAETAINLAEIQGRATEVATQAHAFRNRLKLLAERAKAVALTENNEAKVKEQRSLVLSLKDLTDTADLLGPEAIGAMGNIARRLAAVTNEIHSDAGQMSDLDKIKQEIDALDAGPATSRSPLDETYGGVDVDPAAIGIESP